MRVVALLFCVVACAYAAGDLPLCPDAIAKEFCQQGETCCLIGQTEIGCCPLPNASCCDDQQTCCAQGYACGPNQTCTKKSGKAVMAALAIKKHHH